VGAGTVTDRKTAMKAAVTAALAIAEDVTAGRLDVAALDAAALAECRELFGRVDGPEDALWPLHVDVARQVLAVGGGVGVDELAEWVAVYRAQAAEAAEAELVAAAPADRGPSWIESVLAEDAEDADVGV
jgi:hypothetical protein